MAASPLALLRHLPANDAHAVDGELLRRYAEGRDEAAFAELVRRNGPLVLRACRNVLRDPAGADDAFQATFLLLARHAARLTGRPSIAGWLHTVAVRAAGKLRRAEARRRRREELRPAAPLANGPADDATWAEVRERIDAELARLPETYRLPLLLCYAQGLGYEDAARRIGCTLGALRGRLERGREMLRRRLGPWTAPAVLVTVGALNPVVGASLLDATLSAARSATPLAHAAGAWARWVVAAALGVAALTGIGLAAFRGPAAPPNPTPAPQPTEKTATEKTDTAGDPLPPGAIARMGSSRFHHGSNVHRLTVSGDGKWVISYGSHTGYRVWDLETGKEQVPVGMPSDARFVASRGIGRSAVQWEATVAPAGKRVVAVAPDRKQPVTRILDVVTGAEVAKVPVSLSHVLTRPGHTSDREPELSADGKWMLWTRCTFENGRTKQTVYITDLTAKEPAADVFTEITTRNLFGLAFAADGKSVLMHFQDAYEVWDRDTRASKLKVPVVPDGNWVGHAIVSPDGKTLAVVQPSAATFQLWDVAAKKQLPAVAEPFASRVDLRAFTPDGRQIAASDPSGPLRVWDVATGKKVRDYEGAARGAWAAAFTPDGKRLAVAQFDDVNVIDLATGKPIHDFGGHAESVGYLGFAAEGRLVSAASSGLVWEPRTGRKLGAFSGHLGGSYGEIVSPDGKWIASCGADQKVRLRDASTLGEVWVSETKGVIGYAVAFTPNGKELAVGADKPGVRVFDVATGKQQRVVAANEVVNRLQFTPDGKRAVFRKWGDKNKVRVWDWAADKELLSLAAGKGNIQATAISPDGRFLAAGDWDGFARLFDLETGKQVREFDVNPPDHHERDTNTVYAVAFSPDGRTLAAGSASGDVRVWELATDGERFRLEGHRGPIMAVAFSPSGALLVSGSSDRSAVTWDATGAFLPTDPKHRPKDAADAWARLADHDASAGCAALRYLAAHPAEAVPLFAKNVPAVAAADPKVVTGWIEKLDSADFATREAAEKELTALAGGAVDQLRSALASESAEVRQRLGRVLAPFGGPARAGDRLRVVRAVEAAERAGTADARKLLRAWAGGARGAELTDAARSALARLGDGPAPR